MAVTPYRVPGLRIPGLLAGANLAANQYRFVKPGATEGQVIAIAAVTDVPCGIQLDKPDAAGKQIEVETFGITEVEVGAAVTYGDRLQCDAVGRAIAAAATGFPVARALGAATAAGQRIPVFVYAIAPAVF
jgi:hypothetical protein